MDKLKFVRMNIFGSKIYRDKTNKFYLFEDKETSRYYIYMNSVVPEWQGDGFKSVTEAEEYLNSHDWKYATEQNIRPKDFKSDLIFLLRMYFFARCDVEGEYLRPLPDGYICINDLGDNTVEVYTHEENSAQVFDNLDDVAQHIDNILNEYEKNNIFCKTILCNPTCTKQAIKAAISTRELSRNLVRVRSSNVWAYTMNIRDRKDKTGEVLVQFKGPKGGPGDVYLYYDVPVLVWRKWLSAPSKGHFFWAYIRDVYKYRKLTGDRKGKLHNAIN